MRRYLVTGGAGFIGSHLVDSLLADGNEVLILDDFSSGKRENLNSKAKLIEGSLLDHQLLLKVVEERLDGCFHLAARPIVQETIQHWEECTKVNLLGTVSLFEALTGNTENTIPVVYASSCAVYGTTGTRGVGIKESDSLDPQSPYAVDKYSCELHAKAGGKNRGLYSLGARFFNVFGERQDPRSPYSGVVSKFRENLMNHSSIEIYGDGKQTRDFIHVSDIVELLKRSFSSVSSAAPVLNFGTGKGVSINDLAHTMVKISGTKTLINHNKMRSGDVRYSQADTTNMSSSLQYTASSSLAQRLEELMH
jgi:UDP-glucose 4-epimerase